VELLIKGVAKFGNDYYKITSLFSTKSYSQVAFKGRIYQKRIANGTYANADYLYNNDVFGRTALCGHKDCKRCFQLSFATIKMPMNMIWSETNDTNPWDHFKMVNNKKNFCCCVCKSTIPIRLQNVTKGNGCMFCTNKAEKNAEDF